MRGDVASLVEAALSVGDGNRMPVHMAERGTPTAMTESAFGLSQSAEQTLRRIEAALQRIEDGSYGFCLGTGKRISKARLDAIPYAEYCLDYAAELERAGRNPLEAA